MMAHERGGDIASVLGAPCLNWGQVKMKSPDGRISAREKKETETENGRQTQRDRDRERPGDR